jgi:hypothetical protein
LGPEHTLNDVGMSDDSVPVNTIHEPGCQRKLAIGDPAAPEVEMWPRSMRCTTDGTDSEACRTTMGGRLPERWMSNDENGRDAMVPFVGAARQSWNAAGSPTFTSDVQKATLEPTI